MSHFLKMKKLSLIAMTALSTLAAAASAATSIDSANPFNAPLTAAKDAAPPNGAQQVADVKTLGLAKKVDAAKKDVAAQMFDDGKACTFKQAANALDAKQQAPNITKLAGTHGGGGGGVGSDATTDIAADAKNTLIPDGAGITLAGSAQKPGAAVLGAASALMA